jgi:hypothetical protein
MRNTIKIFIATAFFLSLSTTVLAALPTELSTVIAEAQTHHQADYLKLQNLEDLIPDNYLKARVQKPTAARAMKRLDIHEGVLLEALLKPSLDLVPPQTFPNHMSEREKAKWKNRVLEALQVGAAAALTHRQTPHVEAALALSLSRNENAAVKGPLCVFYGRIARHAEGVARLKLIAETSAGRVQESAIIGLGKSRQLAAFHALEAMLTQSSDAHIQKAALNAMGHLANRAARKAKPMQDDAVLQAKVKQALVSRIDKPQELPYEKIALTSLTLVLNINELDSTPALFAQMRARKQVAPVLSRLQKRALLK